MGATLPPAVEPDLLLGNGGSPGVARGPAKEIHSLAEASKLQKGDNLVAETTTPAWTPLFATTAAVVTDTGGALSHGAVVARVRYSSHGRRRHRVQANP
jgi:rifampicin phosphotransferase